MPSVTIYAAPFGEDMRHSRALLSEAATRHTGRSPGPVACTPAGKPFFPETPGLHCSVSHSGDWWLCAAADTPVGLDLQIHRSYLPPEKLSARFFHPLESAFLEQMGYDRFFDLWCAKESYVKFTGQGFTLEPDRFSVVSENGTFPAAEGCVFRILPFHSGYSLCLCAGDLQEIHFLKL